MTCNNCKHYFKQFMECRRNPPSVGINRNGVFPLVNSEDWCGEFSQKPVDPIANENIVPLNIEEKPIGIKKPISKTRK